MEQRAYGNVLFFVAYKIASYYHPPKKFLFEGENSKRGYPRPPSIPKTLHYLLAKSTVSWLENIFGLDGDDKVRALSFINRQNAEGKNRNLPFGLRIAPAGLSPDDVILCSGTKLSSIDNWPEVVNVEGWVDLYNDVEQQLARDYPGYRLQGVGAFLPPSTSEGKQSLAPLPEHSSATSFPSLNPPGEKLTTRLSIADFVEDLVSSPGFFPPQLRRLDPLDVEELEQLDHEKLEASAGILRAMGYSSEEQGRWFESYQHYKCSSLFYRHIEEHDLALETSLQALRATRPLGNGTLIRQASLTVNENFQQPKDKHLRQRRGATFLSLLASLLADFGFTQDGLLICQRAEELFCQYLKEKRFRFSNSDCEIQHAYNKVRLGHMSAQDKRRAFELLQRALELFQEYAVRRGIGIAHFSIVRLFAQYEENGKALDYLSEHDSEIVQCSKWAQTNKIAALGYLLHSLGKPREAIPHLEMALEALHTYNLASQSEDGLPEWGFYRPDRLLGPENQLVKVLGPVKGRDPFPFSTEETKDLVRNASAA